MSGVLARQARDERKDERARGADREGRSHAGSAAVEGKSGICRPLRRYLAMAVRSRRHNPMAGRVARAGIETQSTEGRERRRGPGAEQREGEGER